MQSLGKKLIIITVVLALLGIGGFFGRKAYKKTVERRLVRETKEYLEQKNWRGASLTLRRSLQLNPHNLEASKMMADLMEASGSPVALDWRVRVVELDPGSSEYRMDWARTAVRLRDFTAASNALSGLSSSARTNVTYHKLMGGLELALSRPEKAESHYAEALRLEPTNQLTLINLATVRLGSTNLTQAAEARGILKSLVTNKATRPMALTRLRADALYRQSTNEAIGYSRELVNEAEISIDEKMDHLRLLSRAGSPEEKPFLENLKEQATKSSAIAYSVGRWITIKQSPAAALAWLKSLPPETSSTEPVPQVMADCLILMKNWPGLLALLESGNWGESEFYRLGLTAMAQRTMGETVAAESSWRKAMRLSTRRLDRLTRLSKVAEAAGMTEERLRVLQEITESFPKERWAGEKLAQHFYAAGDTKAIHHVLSKIHSSNPADPSLKNSLAYIRLLLRTDMENAHRMAKEAYQTAPEDSAVITTYAYSLFLNGNGAEAVELLKKLNPESLKNPRTATCYTVINAHTGDKVAAKNFLKKVDGMQMLPEEREILSQASAHL
ncbi:MAG: hypothetical protein SFY81_14615 [Verrucomicrobiota bacterium]|nr:hypothetical protein [Verrucomicrobiota bacterium]